jgi:hypothetical protein
MARLTAEDRKKLHPSDFAGPGRSFPIPDKDHAEAALIDVGRALKHGSINSAEAAKIRSRARSMLRSK